MSDVLSAEYLAGASKHSQLPPPMFAEIAFAGRSNVGKSSLINTLVNRRKLVRTSSTPGCTRALQLFRIGLRGDATIDFVDLPGFGYAKRSKSERKGWGPMIENFLVHRPGLRAVVVIVDIRRGMQPEEEQLIEFLRSIDRTPVLVVTKIDKLSANKRKPAVLKIGKQAGLRAHGFSSHSKLGVEALWKTLKKVSHIDTTTVASAEAASEAEPSQTAASEAPSPAQPDTAAS